MTEIQKTVRTLLERVPPEHRKRGATAGGGATIGAVMGSMLAGPVGATVGAALGGALAVILHEKTNG